MSIELYGAFVLACILLALTPGPNMSLFIANGTAHGTRAALLTVLGATLGLGVLVALATIGMTSAMAIMAEWFDVIRWGGAAYLAWLGIGRLRAAFAAAPLEPVAAPADGRYIWQGALVSLSNPKVLLFLGAFFPQFINPAAPIAPQLTRSPGWIAASPWRWAPRKAGSPRGAGVSRMGSAACCCSAAAFGLRWRAGRSISQHSRSKGPHVPHRILSGQLRSRHARSSRPDRAQLAAVRPRGRRGGRASREKAAFHRR
jgi:homoserine/homoserine lactone efflux protein